jgi:hypothetical protein
MSVALVLVSAYFSFSKATVTIYPKEEPAATDFSATLDTAAGDAASLDLVPGRIERSEKDGSKTVTQVESKLVPDYAHVTVTIYNKQGSSQGLLPKTQLVNADGIKFRTDESVNVPGGSSVQVGATADQTGKEYNVGPSRFSIIKLSTELQEFVYAESTEAATGGERPSTSVTEDDIKAAQDALADELFVEAETELATKLSGTEQYVPEAVAKKVVEKTASVEAGAAVESFDVTVKVEAVTVIFDENGLLQLAIAKLNESLPEDRELVSYDPATFEYEISAFDQKKGAAKVSASLSGVARPRLPTEAFDRGALKGKTRKQVDERYAGFTQVERVDVRFVPFFAFIVPTIIDSISIEVGKSPSAQSQTEIPAQ